MCRHARTRDSILRSICQALEIPLPVWYPGCVRQAGFILELVDEQWSLGDFVLTGGELAAMTMVDSIVRLLPGVLGGETSAEVESFSDGKTLEYPQYTRPEEFQGLRVPDVLLSGHHGKIAEWRAKQSAELTEAYGEKPAN